MRAIFGLRPMLLLASILIVGACSNQERSMSDAPMIPTHQAYDRASLGS